LLQLSSSSLSLLSNGVLVLSQLSQKGSASKLLAELFVGRRVEERFSRARPGRGVCRGWPFLDRHWSCDMGAPPPPGGPPPPPPPPPRGLPPLRGLEPPLGDPPCDDPGDPHELNELDLGIVLERAALVFAVVDTLEKRDRLLGAELLHGLFRCNLACALHTDPSWTLGSTV